LKIYFCRLLLAAAILIIIKRAPVAYHLNLENAAGAHRKKQKFPCLLQLRRLVLLLQ
jgi:hypothetical protein